MRFRVGTGATALNAGDPVHNPDGGGVIAPNESFSVRFSVVVGADTPDGTQILNTASALEQGRERHRLHLVASAPAAVAVRGVPDVTIDKSHTGTFVRGQQGTFSLLVSNVGGRATSGPVVIDDTLPGGLCGRQRERRRLGVLGRHDRQLAALRALRPARGGRGLPPVSVVVNVLESAPDTIINTGITGGGSEINTSNNTDSDTVAVTSSPTSRSSSR